MTSTYFLQFNCWHMCSNPIRYLILCQIKYHKCSLLFYWNIIFQFHIIAELWRTIDEIISWKIQNTQHHNIGCISSNKVCNISTLEKDKFKVLQINVSLIFWIKGQQYLKIVEFSIISEWMTVKFQSRNISLQKKVIRKYFDLTGKYFMNEKFQKNAKPEVRFFSKNWLNMSHVPVNNQ